MDVLKSLTQRKISVRSPAGAIQDLTQRLEYNTDQYRALYNELTDTKTDLNDEEVVYHTRYLVNEIVRCNNSGVPLDIQNLVRDSNILAVAFLKRLNGGDLSYVKSITPSIDSENLDTSSNSKRGDKKRVSEEIYRRLYKESTREEIIVAFIEQGFDSGSATAYYYMNSRKYGKPEKELGKKSRRGKPARSNQVKKGDLAVGIYRQHYLSVPKEDLIKIIAQEMNIEHKDAAGYYYVGRRAVGAQSATLCPNQKKRKVNA